MSIPRAEINSNFIHHDADLPYSLTASEIAQGISETYRLLFEVNDFLLRSGFSTLEDLLLGNSFSGVISELLVKNISSSSSAVCRNERIGGHPDLIPRNIYPNDQTLRGEEGLEIKSSKQPGGWQGHNPENSWVIIFRYTIDTEIPALVRPPITFVQVLAAKLEFNDWTFSGRNGNSRRTITASINERGMDKLRSNPVYQDPRYIVAPNKTLREKYELIARKSAGYKTTSLPADTGRLDA